MRKLFWCCAAAAVAAAGTVYLAAKHVEQHPYAVLGQTVLSVCGGGCASGAAGGGQGESVVPAEPAPVGGSPFSSTSVAPGPMPGTEPSQVVAIAEPTLPGHIVVSEGPTSDCYSGEPAAGCTMPSVAGCPEAVRTPVPAVMPYCTEDSGRASEKMPYADEESCESPTTTDQPLPECEKECPHDVCPGHGHHHGGGTVCPFTGRSYPDTKPCPAVPDVDDPQAERKDRPETKKGIESEEDEEAPHMQLDTMEYRPSDAGLHRFIPGEL